MKHEVARSQRARAVLTFNGEGAVRIHPVTIAGSKAVGVNITCEDHGCFFAGVAPLHLRRGRGGLHDDAVAFVGRHAVCGHAVYHHVSHVDIGHGGFGPGAIGESSADGSNASFGDARNHRQLAVAVGKVQGEDGFSVGTSCYGGAGGGHEVTGGVTGGSALVGDGLQQGVIAQGDDDVGGGLRGVYRDAVRIGEVGDVCGSGVVVNLAAGRGCPTGFDISGGSLIGELHIVHSVYDSSVFDDEDADGIAGVEGGGVAVLRGGAGDGGG